MTTSRPLQGLLAIGIAAAAAFATGACSSPSDKKAEVTSEGSTTVVSPATSQAAPSSTTAGTAPAGPTTTRSPATTRPSAASQTIVVAPNGLGVVNFGESADVTVARLKAKLGAPRADGAPMQPCSSKITRSVDWDGLSVHFGPTFIGYQSGGPKQVPRYRTEANIGIDSTVAQLKAAYGSKVTLDPGEEGTRFSISLPKGTIRGAASGPEDSDFVYDLSAGTTCG